MSENVYEPPQAVCVDAEVPTTVRHFSVAIFLSYIGLGFKAISSAAALVWALVFIRPAVIMSVAGETTGLLLQGAFCVLLAATLVGLRKRQDWARIVMLVLLVLCLGFHMQLAIRDGLAPAPVARPLVPANEAQQKGARFANVITPYVLGAVELSMLWAFLFRPGVKGQFVRQG